MALNKSKDCDNCMYIHGNSAPFVRSKKCRNLNQRSATYIEKATLYDETINAKVAMHQAMDQNKRLKSQI